MLILIGIVAGVLAFFVGKWRHSCIYWSHTNPANLPLGWRKPELRTGALLLVAVLTIIFATCISLWLRKEVSELVSDFAWGVLVFVRWAASGAVARMQCEKQKEEIEKFLRSNESSFFEGGSSYGEKKG